jgi:ribonuclease HI
LEYFYTNNQAEYEALLFHLEILEFMGVKHVEAFGDSFVDSASSFLKVPMLRWITNANLDKCLDVIARFDIFFIHHIYRHEDSKANNLAQ